MSCTVEFLVHSNEGAPSLFKLEVPDVSEMSLEDAIGALMGNVESYNDFINAVNSGVFQLWIPRILARTDYQLVIII